MQVDTLLSGRWVVPVTPGDPILENHAIVMNDGKIIALLPEAEALARYQPRQHHQRSDHHLIIPGLINAHTHAAMSLFRGLADDLPLMRWLNDHIWPAEGRWVGPEFVADGSRLAIAEMLRGGITCFNDMYFFPNHTAEVAAAAGMRAVVGLIVIDFPSAWGSGPQEYLQRGSELLEQLRAHPTLHAALAPHAPYSVADEALRAVVALANREQLPMHIHLHETAEEIALSIERYGVRPLERLELLGLSGPHRLAVHMTQLTDAEIAHYAASGGHIVHCPESNLKLASGFCPVQKLLDAGINVALGSDSAASNNDLDLLGEMRTAALLAKGVAANAAALPAMMALRMATINGAKALGLEQQIGSLEPGKAADITVIDMGVLAVQPIYQVVSQLVYASSREQVSDLWVAGRQLLHQGKLLTLDSEEIMARAAVWRERIK